MLKLVRPVSLMLLSAALCSAGNGYGADRATAPRVDITQQQGSLKGNVVDVFSPVTGASVVVKGTTNGTVTDMDGNFALTNGKNGDIIQISFIGYLTQEIITISSNNIKIYYL